VAGIHQHPLIINRQNQVTEEAEYWAAMQCQGCGKFICAGVRRKLSPLSDCEYVAHYPLGKPNDEVASEVPEKIATDFSEALRCQFVNSYNATAEMCRRAIQASCLDLGAKPKDGIMDQIDWVHSQGKITTPLRDVAHKIRLGGNRAAHPNDDEDPISPEEADAVIAFTRHYLDHVYVVPARLGTIDFTKAARQAAKTSSVP